MLNSSDLARWIEEHAIQAEVIALPETTLTVQAAAQAMGTAPEQIVKSLLFLVDGKPIMAIACGTSRIDRRLIAAYYGVGRKRVKLADADTVLEMTGYPVGAVPPFGQRQRFPTFLDRGVLKHAQVYTGGGDINTLLRVSPVEILRVTQAIELDLLEPPPPNGT